MWQFFIDRFGVGHAATARLYISHLLFADDTLFYFMDANGKNFLYILFNCFEAVTGLKVNMGKSEVVLIGNVSNMAKLADILCFKIVNLLMTYLGMLLGASFKVLFIWKRWNANCLIGRRYICPREGG